MVLDVCGEFSTFQRSRLRIRLYPLIDGIMKCTAIRPVPLKYGKHATKYWQIYGYFLQCRRPPADIDAVFHTIEIKGRQTERMYDSMPLVTA